MSKFLITGATSGIGHELAARLIARGDSVFLTGRSSEKLQTFGSPYLVADLTSPGAAEKIVSAAAEAMGSIVCR